MAQFSTTELDTAFEQGLQAGRDLQKEEDSLEALFQRAARYVDGRVEVNFEQGIGGRIGAVIAQPKFPGAAAVVLTELHSNIRITRTESPDAIPPLAYTVVENGQIARRMSYEHATAAPAKFIGFHSPKL